MLNNKDTYLIKHDSAEIQNEHNLIDTTFVNIGLLVSEIVSGAAKSVCRFTLGTAHKIFAPLHRKKVRPASHSRLKALTSLVRSNGLIGTVKLAVEYAANNKRKFFGTAVNYAVPVLAVGVLCAAVYKTASTDYGLTVECNGKELGVVSAESVVNGAAEKIAGRAAYYDTDATLNITANLSIKPLNALDEVMDEVALADKLEEEIIPAPEGSTDELPIGEDGVITSEQPENEAGELDGKIKAFAVTVDGELVGAVEDTNEITNYIETKKSEYLGENVVSVGFDREIEFGYEQYVYPSEIVSQQSIIDKFNSIVAEPVYYTIQEGDSPWSIAESNELSLDELLQCPAEFSGEPIDDLTVFCPVGATIRFGSEVPYLQVVLTKKINYTGIIDYDIEYTEDDSLYKGETVVDTAGVEGEAEYEALVTYQGDIQMSKEITSQRVISEPVTKKVRIGTRETITPVSTGSGGSGDYFWPVDGGYISAYMGDGRGHKGIDIAAPYGTPIYAASSGTVSRAGNKGDGYGNCIFITQDDGNITVYGHQSSLAVSVGDYVVKGQLIGYVGSTGDSTGNHLHFEVRTSGRYIDPLDYVSQY